MKKANELYTGEYFGNYSPIVSSFGNVVIQVDDNDYQGDSRVLYHEEGGKVGYLLFGWGSCSGCDALQACNTYEEVDELIKELHDQVKWFDTVTEAYEWFKTHDWEGDYSYSSEEMASFREQVEKYLYDKIPF